MVFAFHTEDPTSSADLKQHVFRGARTILLFNEMDKRRIDDASWTEHIMTARNVRTKRTERPAIRSVCRPDS